MPLSLKDQNKLPLLTIGLANLALLIVAIHGDTLDFSAWKDTAAALKASLPAGIGLVLMGVANSLLSPIAKARLVFGRWHHPLPGSEAFTRWVPSDDRIDVQALERAYRPLPTDPREQNTLWYKLYKSVENEVSVNHIHREFLFTRDYACLAFMMLWLFGAIAIFQCTSARCAASYLLILAIQAVLVRRAARQNGRRLVTTVLARATQRL